MPLLGIAGVVHKREQLDFCAIGWCRIDGMGLWHPASNTVNSMIIMNDLIPCSSL
jgi:hypothetical protein